MQNINGKSFMPIDCIDIAMHFGKYRLDEFTQNLFDGTVWLDTLMKHSQRVSAVSWIDLSTNIDNPRLNDSIALSVMINHTSEGLDAYIFSYNLSIKFFDAT